MTKFKSAAAVGAAVIVTLVLAFFFYAYLKHYNPNSYRIKVTFDDTRGILPQSAVRMQGVNIGEVSEVALDTSKFPPKPTLTLSIDKKYSIPSNSQFVIIQGLLITTPQIEVRPVLTAATPAPLPKDNTAVVAGAPSEGALASLSPDLQNTVQNLNKSFTSLNARLTKTFGKVDKLMDQTTVLVQNSNKTITRAQGFLIDPKLKASLQETLGNFRDVSRQASVTAKDLSSQLTSALKGGRGKIEKLSDNALTLVNKLGDTIDNANGVVKKLTEQVSDPRLQQSLQETVELGRSTLASVRQITSDFHQLTGDPNVQANLKATLENLKGTSEQSQETFRRVNSLLGKVDQATSKKPKIRLPPVSFLGNVSEQIDPSRLRVDVEARVGLSRDKLINVGLYDLGESTRFDLQAGNLLKGNWLARYGLYASKLGVGLESDPKKSTGVRFDLYSTNRPRLDARGLIGVNKNASLWIGADNVFRRPSPVFGIQIKR